MAPKKLTYFKHSIFPNVSYINKVYASMLDSYMLIRTNQTPITLLST